MRFLDGFLKGFRGFGGALVSFLKSFRKGFGA